MLTDVRFSMPDIEETKNTSSSGDNELISSDVLASGEVQLFDMNGFTMQHATRLSFSVLRIYIRFLQTAFPVRIRQIHMINCPTYLNKIVAIVRPFLSREVFNMVGISDKYPNLLSLNPPLFFSPLFLSILRCISTPTASRISTTTYLNLFYRKNMADRPENWMI